MCRFIEPRSGVAPTSLAEGNHCKLGSFCRCHPIRDQKDGYDDGYFGQSYNPEHDAYIPSSNFLSGQLSELG